MRDLRLEDPAELEEVSGCRSAVESCGASCLGSSLIPSSNLQFEDAVYAAQGGPACCCDN